jgi:VCBS repeat protein
MPELRVFEVRVMKLSIRCPLFVFCLWVNSALGVTHLVEGTHPRVDVGPTWLAEGDFNADGIRDLASVSQVRGTVSILLGRGDDSFLPFVVFPCGTNPNRIAVADFNNDGVEDLGITNLGTGGTGSLAILLGNGDGSFGEPIFTAVGTFPSSIAIGKFDLNNFLDILIPNSSDGDISLLLGNGDGTFHSRLLSSGTERPYAMVAADFNNDGLMDFATSSVSAPMLNVQLGNGAGAFGTIQANPSVLSPWLAVTDLDHDGVMDIVTADSSTNDVDVMHGGGDGSFDLFWSAETNGLSFPIALFDLDRDSYFDLVTVRHCFSCTDSVVSVFPGNNAGTFDAPQEFPVDSQVSGAFVSDMNGSGSVDLVSMGADSLITFINDSIYTSGFE